MRASVWPARRTADTAAVAAGRGLARPTGRTWPPTPDAAVYSTFMTYHTRQEGHRSSLEAWIPDTHVPQAEESTLFPGCQLPSLESGNGSGRQSCADNTGEGQKGCGARKYMVC